MLNIVCTDEGFIEVNEELVGYVFDNCAKPIVDDLRQTLETVVPAYINRENPIDALTNLRREVATSLGLPVGVDTELTHHFYTLTRYENENILRFAQKGQLIDLGKYEGRVYIKAGDKLYNWYQPSVRVLSDHFLYLYSCNNNYLFFLAESCETVNGLQHIQGFNLSTVASILGEIKPR